MRLITIAALFALLLTACAATNTATTDSTATLNKTPKRAISSITFVNSSPPVSAKLRRDRSLTVDSELNAKSVTKDGYNTVLNEKSGKITRSQFNSMAAKLNAANYVQLKPKQGQAAVGQGKETLIVSSDLGAHRFVNGAGTVFPAVIAEIFAMKDQLLPE